MTAQDRPPAEPATPSQGETGTPLRFYQLWLLGDMHGKVGARRPVAHSFIDGVGRNEGEPIAGRWPKEARICLDSKEARRLQGAIRAYGPLLMGELIGTTCNSLIAGPKLRELIERYCPGVPIEFLPLSIYRSQDAKRPLPGTYCFVHPVGFHDCIDLERSSVLWDDDHREPLNVRETVIDAKRGAAAPQLFRPLHDWSSYIIRYDLAKAISDAGLDNVLWEKLVVSGESGTGAENP
jgi:hypothetical protein